MKVQGNDSDTGAGEPGGTGVGAEGFIDKKEVARRTGIHPRTINVWMKNGLLPYYKLGRSVRFKWSEIEAHLAVRGRVRRSSDSDGASAGAAEGVSER